MKRLFLVLCTLMIPAPIGAHPHVFVDTGLRAIFDGEGRLTHIEVTWRYDDFYSLLITEDMGLDADFDGHLTPEETEQLRGFDMRWVDGFAGDLVLEQTGQRFALSGPLQPTAAFEDGRITTTHLRAVSAPPDGRAGPLTLKAYDPTYYTAYEMTLAVTIEGAPGCGARVKMPNLTADINALKAQLSTLDVDSDPEDAGLPNIGEALAAEVTIRCVAS